MPLIAQSLSALKGEVKRIRYVFTDENRNPINLSSGVTFTGKLFDEEQVIATYANGDYITTLASSGYIELLVDCFAEGEWKLLLQSNFSAGPTVDKHILSLRVDAEEPPTVTRELDGFLADLQISATGGT